MLKEFSGVSTYKISQGKYKNKFLKDIPSNYLKWAIMNFDKTTAAILALELQRRDPSYKSDNETLKSS